jgi:hypothetical protein
LIVSFVIAIFETLFFALIITYAFSRLLTHPSIIVHWLRTTARVRTTAARVRTTAARVRTTAARVWTTATRVRTTAARVRTTSRVWVSMISCRRISRMWLWPQIVRAGRRHLWTVVRPRLRRPIVCAVRPRGSWRITGLLLLRRVRVSGGIGRRTSRMLLRRRLTSRRHHLAAVGRRLLLVRGTPPAALLRMRRRILPPGGSTVIAHILSSRRHVVGHTGSVSVRCGTRSVAGRTHSSIVLLVVVRRHLTTLSWWPRGEPRRWGTSAAARLLLGATHLAVVHHVRWRAHLLVLRV